MNGPNPVCTLATKKLSQSSPAGLRSARRHHRGRYLLPAGASCGSGGAGGPTITAGLLRSV